MAIGQEEHGIGLNIAGSIRLIEEGNANRRMEAPNMYLLIMMEALSIPAYGTLALPRHLLYPPVLCHQFYS